MLIDPRTDKIEDSVFTQATIDVPDGLDIRLREKTAQVSARIEDIQRLVANDTGWDIDFSQVTYKVVDRDTFSRRAIEDGLKTMGYTEQQIHTELNPSNKVGCVKLTMALNRLERMCSAVCLLASDPREILINQHHLNTLNEDSLAKVLYHELIHHGQMQRYHEFFKSIKVECLAAIDAKNVGGKASPEYKSHMDTVAARMSWIEGQPTYLESTKGKEHFPNAKQRLSAVDFVLILGGLFNRASRDKAMQLISGMSAFKAVIQDSPALIDTLFENPKLVDILLKSSGRVDIQVKEGSSELEITDALKLVQTLSKYNPRSGRNGLDINIRLLAH